jgi:NADH-quinone oxidoreductase subunit H
MDIDVAALIQVGLYVALVLGLIVGILLLAGGLTWVERRVLALFQDRYGPNRVGPAGLLQVLADMIKLFWKEDWVAPFADKTVFVIAPLFIVIFTIMSFAFVRWSPGTAVADLNVGLLFFLGMSSMSVYSVALGGWSANNKYALIGSMRAIGQMISYEVFMGLSLMGVVMMAGSFSLGAIVRAQEKMWFCVPQIVGLVVFLLAGLAETRRIPFDLPEAENELVAGYHSEYSGMKFAMFFMGEYIGVALISTLLVVLFFGGWLGPILPGVWWFLLKVGIAIVGFVLIRGSLPRPRYDQLMAVGWRVLLPLSLVNLVVTAALVLSTGS